ncbi:MAG: glycosyltransferase family 39 protein, partial [Bdellovibrionales bacterium]|nr:glycosyltransferase family 39 protein [Bdellovibrionales bacterium]
MILSLVPLVILVLFRFWGLDLRPIHHDEAVNGWFVDGLLTRGYYIYDPENYHGPVFFYILALFEKVFGRNVIALRIPAVLFGVGLTFSPFLFRKWIGFRAAWISVAALTLSPALVFFSRYSIHESAFALCCVIFLRIWLQVRESGASTRMWALLGLAL